MTALLAAGALVSGLSSVFGGGGPDKEKYAKREADVKAANSLAQGGSFDAWLFLGAIGNVQALPKDVNLPGMYMNQDAQKQGWTSREWGTAYGAIVSEAAKAFNTLAPRFVAQGSAYASVGGNFPVLLAGSTVPVGQTPLQNGAGSTLPGGGAVVDPFSFAVIPWYGWVAIVLALLLVWWYASR